MFVFVAFVVTGGGKCVEFAAAASCAIDGTWAWRLLLLSNDDGLRFRFRLLFLLMWWWWLL